MPHRQLVIVGAGPGGYVAAIKAAQLGLEVTVVERAEAGGVCLNRGCIPTKTILHSAMLFAELRDAEGIGVRVEGACVDYGALRTRVGEVSGQLRAGVEALLSANGVELVRGTARIEAGGRVVVTGADGGEDVYEGDDVIVATGSVPAMPPIEGIGLPGVLDSDALLAGVPELSRLAIIGGGVIGVEFACAYAALGTQVTVYEMAPRLLPTMDREFGTGLAAAFKRRGVTVRAGASVERIEEAPGGLSVRASAKGKDVSTEADAVLVATGRRTDTESLFADGCAPAVERGRIVVDEVGRTNVARLWAIGDVAGDAPQLAHAASAQGVVAVCAIAGAPCAVNAEVVPSCVYTSPEIASVGLTEDEAKAAGIAVRTGKFLMGGNGKTLISEHDRGFVKVVADENGRVVGAHLMCGHATDIVGELSVAVANGLSVEQLAAAVRPHPTFEEGVGEAVEALLGGAIHAMPAKRR